MKKALACALAASMALSLCSCTSAEQVLPQNPFAQQQTHAKVESTEAPEETEAADAPGPQGWWSASAQDAFYGNEPGNLLGGHMVIPPRYSDKVLFVALEDGVYALGEEDLKWTKVSSDKAHDLNERDGRLYYVVREGDVWSEEGASDSIVSVSLDGSDRKVLLEGAKVGRESRYNYEDYSKTSFTNYTGITDLALWDNQLFFIAENGKKGTVECYNPYEDRVSVTTYESGKSIFRMNVEGGEKSVVVEEVGNGEAHMCIAVGGRIYYTTSYDSGWFPYPAVTFNRCLLNGGGRKLLYGETDVSKESAVREIVRGLMVTAEGDVFALAEDSEGDFPHARLMQVQEGAYRFFDEATYHVNPVDGVGGLAYFRHEGDMVYDVDENNVCSGDRLESAWLTSAKTDGSGQETVLHRFDDLMRFGDEFSRFEMASYRRDLYILTEKALYVIDLYEPEMEMRKLADLPAKAIVTQ